MTICRVVGHVWATKKQESLAGLKLMVVREERAGRSAANDIVAVDLVGAGIGEQVLVVSGSTARRACGSDDRMTDSAIVGIIDTLEVDRERSK